MRCPNCGSEINSNLLVCPYCNSRISEAMEQKTCETKSINQRLASIDKLFGLETNYCSMNDETLANYLNRIMNQLNKIDLSNQDFLRIIRHIESVQDEYFSRDKVQTFPSDNSTSSQTKPNSAGTDDHAPTNANNQKLNGDIKSILNLLLHKVVPPDYSSAGFKVRNSVERSLRDKFNFPYNEPKHIFETGYGDMFLKITQNAEEAKKMCYDHYILNILVHSNKINDSIFNEKYPTQTQKIQCIERAYERAHKYKII